MIHGVQSALAGLRAAAQRVGIAAENISNARSTGALQPYDGYVPKQAAQITSATGTPVVTAKPLSPAHIAVYEPDNSDADANGFVGQPNVDLAKNLVDLTLAEHAYKANAASLRTIDELSRALYDDEA